MAFNEDYCVCVLVTFYVICVRTGLSNSYPRGDLAIHVPHSSDRQAVEPTLDALIRPGESGNQSVQTSPRVRGQGDRKSKTSDSLIKSLDKEIRRAGKSNDHSQFGRLWTSRENGNILDVHWDPNPPKRGKLVFQVVLKALILNICAH